MPKSVTQFNVLIASPSDLTDERQIVKQAIDNWNIETGQRMGVVLSPVMWETHAVPEIGERPQAIINKQLVDDCDILIGMFWTRLGSPMGVAESGTVEEINRFIEAGKPVSIYFSSIPINPSKIDKEQYQRLEEFAEAFRTKGLLGEFATQEELKGKLPATLTFNVEKLCKMKFVSGLPDANMIMPVTRFPTEAQFVQPQQSIPAPLVTDVVAVNVLKLIGMQADFGVKLVNEGRMTNKDLIAALDTFVGVYFYDPRIHGLDPTRVDLEHTTANIDVITGMIG